MTYTERQVRAGGANYESQRTEGLDATHPKKGAADSCHKTHALPDREARQATRGATFDTHNARCENQNATAADNTRIQQNTRLPGRAPQTG